MALSLNDLKNPKFRSAKKDTRPKKTPVMPWQQREGDGRSTLEPNRSQTEAVLEPNRSQTEAVLEPNRSQTEAVAKSFQSETRAGTRAEPEPNRSQTRAKLGTKLEPKFGLLDLSTLQRKALDYFFDSCRVNGSRLTEPILISEMTSAMKSTPAAIKKAVQRIEGRRLAVRYRSKAGRGGWTIYELPEPVYKELTFRETRAKLEPNKSQTRAKLEPQLEPQLEPSLPSSSSYIENNFKPTTTAETRARADNEWTPEDLDYSMLTAVGFGRSQALQLRSLGIPFDVVQRSLVYFEFELRYTASGKTIQEPLALLMKRMRQNGCWEAPEEYEKRHAHFRSCFAEREQQLQEDRPVEETSSDLLAAGDSITSPAGVDHGEQLR